MSDTPRTDAEMEDARNVALDFECRNPPPKKGENIYIVSADFARQLERELNAANLKATETTRKRNILIARIAKFPPTL